MKRPLLTLTVSAFALAGCADASFIADLSNRESGMGQINATTRVATGAETVFLQDAATIAATQARVSQMIQGKTINADTAVQVALLNNRGLQAHYADLGLTTAEIWQGTLDTNPSATVEFTGIGVNGLAVNAIEGLIVGNLLSLATRGQRDAIAEKRLQQARLEAASETLAVAAEARAAWVDAVAAFEAAAVLRQAEGTAEAQADLAVELGQTGYLNAAAQAQDQALHAELAGERARAKLDAQIAKEHLTQVLGLWGTNTQYYVPDALPALPERPARVADPETQALTGRVDLAIARLELEAVAAEHNLTSATRYVSDLDLAAGLKTSFDGSSGSVTSETVPRLNAEIAIPIFDSGQARHRAGEMAYLRAAHELAATAVQIRSEARAADAELAGTHQLARHYRDTLVPLRQQYEAQTLRAYNGMIESPAELLDAIRERLDAQLAEAEARADYWRADANMKAVLYGGVPSAR